MGPAEIYHYLFEEIPDPRVTDWPLMAGPVPIVSIILVYLLFVLYVGPLYMKNRKPYSLHNVMICYNIMLTIANATVFYGMLTSGYTTTLTFGCEPVDYSYNPESVSMARWVWWLMLLKVFELFDTVIFVFRKKFNQTSFLHIYHHAMTTFLAWVAIKFAPGGLWTAPMLANCLVHVVMYCYYLMAGLGGGMQKKLAPFKPYITMMQMLQFVFIVTHLSQVVLRPCEVSRRPLAYIYISHIIVLFSMFLDYYKKAYLAKKKV